MKIKLLKQNKRVQITRFVVLFLLIISSSTAFTQNKIITGIIKSSDGTTLLGVNVIQKGTLNGVATDFDGIYSIKVEGMSQTLVYSFLGYKTKEVLIENQSVINMVLEEDSQSLDEIIIIGYGSESKKDMTGSVVEIKTEDLMSNSPVNISQGIQGKLAGVQITSNSGAPGAGNTITIRGVNSI